MVSCPPTNTVGEPWYKTTIVSRAAESIWRLRVKELPQLVCKTSDIPQCHINEQAGWMTVPRCLCSLTIYCRSCVCSHTQHNKHWLSEVKVSGKFSSQTVMGQRLRDERVDTGTSSGRRLDGRQSSFYVGIKCLERKQRGWYESVGGGQNSMEKGGQVYKVWSRGLVMDKGWRLDGRESKTLDKERYVLTEDK